LTEHSWTRRELLSRSALMTLAVASAPVLAACGSDDGGGTTTASGDLLTKLKQQGYVRVGFANEAPYGYADPAGKLTGEAPEVARAIFKKLGVGELQGVLTEFGSLIPGLQARRFDVIAAGMFINPERCAQTLFSEPDYQAKTAFLVKEGNPKGILKFEDVTSSGAKLGVLAGAVEGGYAESLGVPKNQIVTFNDPPSSFEGLQAGRVDAVSLTSISLRNLLDTHKGAPYEVTEPFVPVIDGKEQTGAGGYGFHKGEEKLRDAFNKQLAAIKASGELASIIAPFGFTEAEVATTLTTAELCKG
jgi:polar amino acid transport system substrate-binding protein